MSERNIVIDNLVGYINNEKLKVGDRIPSIPELSKLWNIGRNEIRDGLLKAQSMSIVKIIPRQGTFVQTPDFTPMIDMLEQTVNASLMQEDVNIINLIDTRIILETYIAREAAKHWRSKDLFPIKEAIEAMKEENCKREEYIEWDEKFHIGIAGILDNQVLTVFLRTVLTLLRPYRSKYFLNQAGLENTNNIHESIYKAIVNKDVDLSEKLMKEHLENGRRQVIDIISSI